MPDSYTEAWDARRDLDPLHYDADGSANHDRYLALLVDIEAGPLRDALAEATDELDRFECLRTLPPRWHHVTVKVLGFVVDEPTGERELSPEAAERIGDGVEGAIADAGVGPFDLSFPRLNLWPTVVFCEVHGEGSLTALHRRVLDLPDAPHYEYDGESYTPHATLAHFVGDEELSGLVDWLEANREVAAGTVRVERLRLVADDPTTDEWNYETVREYSL